MANKDKDKDDNTTHSSMEDEESGLEDEDMEEGAEGLTPGDRRQQVISGRGITLSMLIQEGLIEPAENSMSIEYLSHKYTGDLTGDGQITCHQTKEKFASPSAWANSCKKAINPEKKSGCGWASVKYKDIKLDTLKSAWFKRQQPQSSPLAPSPVCDQEEKKEVVEEEKPKPMKVEEFQSEGPLNLSVVKSPSPKPPPAEPKTPIPAKPMKKYPVRPTIKHVTLGRRSIEHDPNILVECTPFAALGKIQPFTISLTSNSLLLVDFHCHLSTSEVVGYLAGKWDPSSQHLSVLQAFPCRCRLGDRDKSIIVEEEIRQGLERRGLNLVGWYHSHPHAPACPSLKDIDAQMDYQLRLKGAGHTYQPCLGLICSPYNPEYQQKESRIDAYWIMPPPETRVNDYGMPMSMHYDSVQDVFLSQDVLNEMQWLIEFYGKEADKVNFSDTWLHSLTYLEKIKGTLSRKFPKDQTDGRFQDYIQNLLLS